MVGDADAAPDIDKLKPLDVLCRVEDDAHCREKRFRLEDSRTDMRMHAHDAKVVAVGNFLHFVDLAMVDAKLRCGAAGNRVVVMARPHIRIDSDAYLCPGIPLAPELEERKGPYVDLHALRMAVRQVGR